MKERVVVAMSGGVDSSVAAALLQKSGYEVIGATMCFSYSAHDQPAGSGRKKPLCCGLDGIEDARKAAFALGIKHYVLKMQDALEKYVVGDFLREYPRGRTPNPCVRCNQHIKFGILLKKALGLGARYLATGHFVQAISTNRQGQSACLLKKGKDPRKDQSYFLYRLNQFQLRHSLFPIGGYTKDEVRSLAKEFGLAVADKVASQEICFLAHRDYRDFLLSRQGRSIPKQFSPGEVVDQEGKLLGQHKGVAFYTIGQREGMGIAKGYPLYITGINSKQNKLVAGPKEEAIKRRFLVTRPHFVCAPFKKKVVVRVRIRYNHLEVPAQVTPDKAGLKVCLAQPQFAVTPGQSAVFYDGDIVLGGGIISRVID